MEILWVSLLLFLLVEEKMPFRGLVSDQMSNTMTAADFRHYAVGWLPTWWLILAASMMSTGIGVGCAVWAIVDQFNGQPIGLPILIGATSLVSAFAGLVVPIALAWFKDRSETREMKHLKERLRELEYQVEINREGHVKNAVNIQKISEASENIVEAKIQARKEGFQQGVKESEQFRDSSS